ncbi:MAG: mechanosensitive ion channel [Proteobacteria bacterium]|nr:mechanosensitive ion channel [Pseudomonadota bacterium]
MARAVLAAVLLAAVLLAGLPRAIAAENPLQPPDLSSPRATLQTLVTQSDGFFILIADVLGRYARSNELYDGAGMRRILAASAAAEVRFRPAMDLSGIPPVLRQTFGIERAVQLMEVLNRIDLPPMDTVPDAAAVAASGIKRWRLPGTEIEFAAQGDSADARRWVVSAETVEQLPLYYGLVRTLPYRPGPMADLARVLGELNGGRRVTVYETFLQSPVGLGRVIPPRWLFELPDWARARFLRVTVWQWSGLMLGAGVGALTVWGARRLARAGRGAGSLWSGLPVPLALIFTAAVIVPTAANLFHIGGEVREAIAFLLTVGLFGGGAWLGMALAGLVANAIVASEHLRLGRLDAQLIRLGARLLGMIAALALVIRGADELGFPAYSVLAGVGVGGLAVALAARDSLANLLGSLLILIEQPFRIGHYVRVGGVEGAVEDVGFRSTRIRTSEHSLISLPNSTVANTTVENLTLRPARRQRLTVQVPRDTPRDALTALIGRVRALLDADPVCESASARVHVSALSDSLWDIVATFSLMVEGDAAEAEARETILLGIEALAPECGVTGTLRISCA